MNIPYFDAKMVKEILLPPAIEKLQELPFEQIKWENFERLCYELAKKDAEVTLVRPYGVQGNEQGGIDIFARNTNQKDVVYQCKNEDNFTPSKIKAAINKYLKGDWVAGSEEFVLCTRESLQKKDRADEIKAQEKVLETKGVALKIWDSVELSSMLKRHPQFVYDFFGIHWFVGFCGWEQLNIINLDYPIPPKMTYQVPDGYLGRTITRSNENSMDAFFQSEKTLIDVFKENQHICLLGWGLNGKSVELENLAAILAADEAYHPHLIKFADYSDEPIASLIENIDHIPAQSLTVLFDGLDEVLPGDFDLIRRKINRFTRDYPLASIVVSCRTNYYTVYEDGSVEDTLRAFKPFTLNYWSYEEVMRHIRDIHETKTDDFMELVNQKQLFDLLRLPFYLKKLSAQFQDNGTIVNSKAEIFEDELRHLIKKEIKRKHNSEQDLHEQHLYELLSMLAFVMEASGTNFIGNSNIQQVIPSANDRKMVTEAASIFYGTDSEAKTYRFHHHNTQEYLTACVMARKPFSVITKTAGIGPDYIKVNPSWFDTILFLYSMLAVSDPLKKNIFDWLLKSNKDLAIKVEPGKLDERIRFKLFRDIFNQYKKEERRINSQLYRYEDIANFAACPQTFEFLFNELEQSNELNNQANAFEIMSDFDIGKYPEYRDRFKTAFKTAIFGKVNDLHYSALSGYTRNFPLTYEELKEVYDCFITSRNDLIRRVLFRTINKLGYSDLFAQEIVDHLKLIVSEERRRFRGNNYSTYLGTEYGELAICVENLKSEKSLTELLSQLKGDFLAFLQLTHFENSLPNILNNIAALGSHSPVWQLLIDLFNAEHGYIINNLKASAAFIDFFKQNKLAETVTADFFKVLDPYNASGINTLSILITKNTIDLIKEWRDAGKVTDKLLDSINYFLQKNDNADLQYFRKVFAIPEPVFHPNKPYSEVETERQERDLQALYDLNAFKTEINLIFDSFGKDDLSYDDLDYSQPDFWSDKFCSVVREYLDIRPSNDPVNRKASSHNIEVNWDKGFFSRIYDYLAKNNKAVLADAQKQKLINWCDLEVKAPIFKNAIFQHNPSYWTLEFKAVMVCFFIRKLSLKSYPEQVYLDMLSFLKHNDAEENIIPFVESVPAISTTQIISAINENLRSGIDNSMLLSNYLEYLKDKNIVDAAPYIIPYLSRESINDRYGKLKIYQRLAGNISGLQGTFEAMKESDEFYTSLLEEFVTEGGSFITKFIKSRFKKEKDATKKLKLSGYLTRLGDVAGTTYYLQRLLESPPLQFSDPETTPLLRITELRYTEALLNILKHTKETDKRAFPGHDLQSVTLRALQNIAMQDKQYERVNKKLKWWLLKETVLLKLKLNRGYQPKAVATIRIFWESITKQHLTNSGRNLKIEEALQIYKSIG